jgi:hypothetical protein
LVVIAASAVCFALLRPAGPPTESEAMQLAKAFLVEHNEFDYPRGYWVRAEWSESRATWRVGFMGSGGYSMLIDVDRDRRCRLSPMDVSFFDAR